MYVRFDKDVKYTTKKGANKEISETLDSFDDAGWILEDNEIVVDIDCLDKEVINRLLYVFDINTQVVWTERGVHLYFKKPPKFNRAKSLTPIGFEVEYKTSNNTFATTIKRAGVKRKIDNEGVRERFPDIFSPGRFKNLLGLGEGSGRNDALYEHKRKIVAIPNHLAILRFINENIFEVPLDEREFDSVTREENFTFEKDQENVLAEVLMKQLKTVIYNRSLYYYHEGKFIDDEQMLEHIVYEYCPTQKTRYVEEVIKQLKMRSEMIPKDFVPKICLKNGHLDNGNFYQWKCEEFTPYYINLEYDEECEPVQIVDDYLNNLTDNVAEYRQMVLQALAMCLITDLEVKRSLAKFFIFVGDGGNGKGTLIEIIKKILGPDNCTSIKINELSDERYLYTIMGKLANLGDDLDNQPIKHDEMSLLKNLTTHDTIMLRKLYDHPQPVRSTATLMFTSNYILSTFDKDKSYRRRVVWCPMYSKPKKKDFTFLSKVTSPEALKYWIKLIVDAYKEIYEINNIVIPENVRDFTKRYHDENDNARIYVKMLREDEIIGQRLPDLYDDYCDWAEENGFNPLGKNNLSSKVKELRGFDLRSTKRGGRTVRVFMKNE